MQVIRVAILERKQIVIDGYHYRLDADEGIIITAEARFGEELEGMLANNRVDVLLIEPCVPVSETNLNNFPAWAVLRSVLESRPLLQILVITSNDDPGMILQAVEIGVNGYILKEDAQAICTLPTVIKSVATGGIHYSRHAHEILRESWGAGTTLTRRQLQALSLCAAYPHESSKELARRIQVRPSTFRSILTRVYKTLAVHSRMTAVQEARRRGWIA